ncbi:hypothetical protein ACU635_51075 [[Actinomadura] parvosata]|uniref:hypothetical protein n=1 Tax=[Actinomadura] parvosata TaxID=1955412 RepID=UPI00406C68EF
MTSIRAAIQRSTPAHEYVAVYAGPDADRRAFCGHLTMRADEAAELISRVEAREPAACPVAAEPVTLHVELARQLACGIAGRTIDGWTIIANEYIEKQRWESLHQLVICNEQGEHFADTYLKGLTEFQSTGPYEEDSPVTFAPVVPTHRVVTEWAAPKAGGAS